MSETELESRTVDAISPVKSSATPCHTMKFLHQYLSKSKSPGLSKTSIIRSKPAQAKQITEQSKAQPEETLSSFFTVSGSGKCDDKWQVTFTSCQGDKRTDRGPGSWGAHSSSEGQMRGPPLLPVCVDVAPCRTLQSHM